MAIGTSVWCRMAKRHVYSTTQMRHGQIVRAADANVAARSRAKAATKLRQDSRDNDPASRALESTFVAALAPAAYDSKLANIATRGACGMEDNVMIGDMIVTGWPAEGHHPCDDRPLVSDGRQAGRIPSQPIALV